MSATSTPTTESRSAVWRRTTHAFCTALLAPPPLDQLLATYFSSTPKITEHGPEWARSRLPFLAHTFAGAEACEEYFKLMGGTLDLQLDADSFPAAKSCVDAEAGVVTLTAKSRCVSKKTGKAWDEMTIHRFSEFDDEGRFGHWEIWADPLSAWEAEGSE